jgi:serine/threonine protein kinase
MNKTERDELLWSAIESGTLDAASAADAEVAGRFSAHQKLESLFSMLCEPSSLDTPPSQIGRYRVDGVLGEGAFGKVFLAYDPELDRFVAIKVPRANVFSSEQDADDFLVEAKLAASLNHRGIVTIHDAGKTAKSCFIVMEYVEGKPLDEMFLECEISMSEIVAVVSNIADALHHAHTHTHRFVHRDLKPGNVLIDKRRQPHITDFGLAVSEKSQLQKVGQVAGTPAYMSPEQIRGETHRLDGRTDIWSLGVILYELLTGRHPFLPTASEDCTDEILHHHPKPPRQINDEIPVYLEEVCLRCLSKDISQRFSTAADVAEALRNPRDLSSPITTVVVPPSRRRYLAWASLGVFAIALAVGLASLLNRPSADTNGHEPTTPDAAEPSFTLDFRRKHPQIADLLGFVYNEDLEASTPAAWIQIEKREKAESIQQWRHIKNGSRLSSAERYRIRMRAPDQMFFYVFQIDTRGTVDWVFPKNSSSEYSTGTNPVPADMTVKVPDGKGNMFLLDDRAGVEHVYVVATRQRWNALESTLADLGRGHQHNVAKARRVEAPIDLKLRGIGGIVSEEATEESLDTGIRGVLVKEIWFHHVEPSK